MKNINRVTWILIIISVSVIVSGYLLPSVVSYYDRQLYFAVPKDTGLDGAISVTLYTSDEGDVPRLVQEINDIFAVISYRSRLPEIYDPETGLPRFPMKFFASRSSYYEDSIQITWLYDSTSVEKAFRDSSEGKFRLIIGIINTTLMSDIGFSELEIGSIHIPERSKYLKTVVNELPGNALLMSIMGIPAFAILLFGIHKGVASTWRIAAVVCVLTVTAGSLLVSTIRPVITGKVKPTHHLLSQPAWRAIAMEQSFSADVSHTLYADEFAWESYPETSSFRMQTGDLTDEFSSAIDFEVEYDIEQASGYFRMVGQKENWLSLTRAQWVEFRDLQVHPRKITNWLRETGSLTKRSDHFKASWELFVHYADRQGIKISSIGTPYILDNYPFPPINWLEEIMLASLVIAACAVLSKIILKTNL